jgi:hypothetical protein
MARRKDTHRSKVYAAERKANPENALGTTDIEGAREIIEGLAQHFGTNPVRGVLNRRIKAWGGMYYRHLREIHFPHPTPSIKTVLHEFAHHLDYERGGTHDGKGHGGSYTEAMIDVVRHYAGDQVAGQFIHAYEAEGCLVGHKHSKEVIERSKAGVARRQDRHGIEEEGWAIRTGQSAAFGDRFWKGNMREREPISEATVWKRKSTAEKNQEKHFIMGEVVKVWAQLDTLYQNRWMALEVIEED